MSLIRILLLAVNVSFKNKCLVNRNLMANVCLPNTAKMVIANVTSYRDTWFSCRNITSEYRIHKRFMATLEVRQQVPPWDNKDRPGCGIYSHYNDVDDDDDDDMNVG